MPVRRKTKIFPYLLRVITFDESLPCTHLSGFLYSSITFAFVLVLISSGTLVHETKWKIFFKTVFFKKKKTQHKKRDKSKPQQRTGPTPAPGCKQQWTCGKAKADEKAADKAEISAFHLESMRWGKANAKN